MRKRMRFALLVATLAASAAHASDFVAEAGERIRAGDVIRVRNRGVFTRSAKFSFFVGGEYAPWRRIDDDTAVVVVPAGVEPGDQWLSVALGLTSVARGANGITRIDVQPEETKTIAAATATLPANDSDALSAGMIRVEGRGVDRRASVTLRQIRSSVETAFVRSTLIAGFDRPDPPLPPFSFDDMFSVEAAQGADLSAITVTVPEAWVKTIPAGFEPELYAYAEERGANDESIPRLDPMGARWTSATRELCAQLAPPVRVTPHQELSIYLAIRVQRESQP